MTEPSPPIIPGEINFNYLRNVVGVFSPVILEIGANDGLTTLELLKQFPNARIYAFEPDPRAIEKFKRNVTDPRASLIEIALGASNGEAEFNVSGGLPANVSPEVRSQYPEGTDRSGSLRRPKNAEIFYPWLKFEKKISVQVSQLDSWARKAGIDKVDFIWADTQGGEGDLIAGGTETLARTRFLYTEYSNNEEYEGQPNLESLVGTLPNFRIVHRFEQDVLLENTAMPQTKAWSPVRHSWNYNAFQAYSPKS